MRIVTTCHKAGWEQYGKKVHRHLKNWPKDAEILWYTEGFELPKGRATGIPLDSIPMLQQFKGKWRFYKAPDWRFDVVRFANKAYAAYTALRDYEGLGVWMDADILAYKPLPEGFIEGLLPEGAYIALFQRDGMHSETGLWLVDGKHPHHKAFMDAFISWYESARFRDAHEWHDCVMMDATIRSFQRAGLIDVHNLSGERSKSAHPMAGGEVAKYLDHMKGPTRKAIGRSPENKERAAA